MDNRKNELLKEFGVEVPTLPKGKLTRDGMEEFNQSWQDILVGILGNNRRNKIYNILFIIYYLFTLFTQNDLVSAKSKVEY